uniref:Uncharacterized protein n=1 Tax=Oscillatoriales cyanobacterium SpSt-402 TaxID=2282168 RepID=A0A832H101_9CYAN
MNKWSIIKLGDRAAVSAACYCHALKTGLIRDGLLLVQLLWLKVADRLYFAIVQIDIRVPASN